MRVLLRDPNKIGLIPPSLQAEIALGDMHDDASLVKACSRIDTILHLAAVAHVNSAAAKDDTNRQGSENLLKAALQQKVKRIVFLSSTLAADVEAGRGDITEYGRGKRQSELLLLEAAEKHAIEVIILRPVNVYGVEMRGNIASMISMVYRGRLPRLPALESRISLLGVEDLASAIMLAASSERSTGCYTVTDGQEYPIAEIEGRIYGCLGKRLPRWRTPAVILYAASVLAGAVARLSGRESGISGRTYRNLTSDNLHSNEDICRELGFQPTQNLYQILPDIVDNIVSEAG